MGGELNIFKCLKSYRHTLNFLSWSQTNCERIAIIRKQLIDNYFALR